MPAPGPSHKQPPAGDRHLPSCFCWGGLEGCCAASGHGCRRPACRQQTAQRRCASAPLRRLPGVPGAAEACARVLQLQKTHACVLLLAVNTPRAEHSGKKHKKGHVSRRQRAPPAGHLPCGDWGPVPVARRLAAAGEGRSVAMGALLAARRPQRFDCVMLTHSYVSLAVPHEAPGMWCGLGVWERRRMLMCDVLVSDVAMPHGFVRSSSRAAAARGSATPPAANAFALSGPAATPRPACCMQRPPARWCRPAALAPAASSGLLVRRLRAARAACCVLC